MAGQEPGTTAGGRFSDPFDVAPTVFPPKRPSSLRSRDGGRSSPEEVRSRDNAAVQRSGSFRTVSRVREPLRLTRRRLDADRMDTLQRKLGSRTSPVAPSPTGAHQTPGATAAVFQWPSKRDSRAWPVAVRAAGSRPQSQLANDRQADGRLDTDFEYTHTE